MPTRWSARCSTSTGSPTRCSDQILDRAEGNPFFLEEIVRQLVDSRSVWLEGERWRAAGDITQVEIPDTVQGVLAARIDLLDPPDRRVLQAAAVVGRIFWPGAVRQLLDGGGDRVPEGAHHPRGARPRAVPALLGPG